MTSDTPEPPHAVGALTTAELTTYRRELERSLKDRTIGSAPIAASLKEKLTEVINEEIEREQHRNSGKKWPINNLGDS